jgi:ferrochelatase
VKDAGVLRRSSKGQSLCPAEDRIGMLLMALGGPDSLEAVGPYLKELRGGRRTSPELIDEITARYRITGGKSPVLAITTELAGKLAAVVQSHPQETGSLASA